jgi:putative heme-binding domain-containing protein
MNTNALLRAFNSTDTDIVAAAARLAGTSKITAVAPQIVPLLSSTNPAVQLAAAEALARCADIGAVEPLVATLTKPMDRFLEHAVIHALHGIVGERIEPLDALLAHHNPRVQKAALLLLSQPPRPASALKAEAVLARIQSTDTDLRRAALELLKSRQDWSSHALRVANDWLGRKELTAEERVGLGALCTAFFGTAVFQDALRASLANGAPAVRQFVLSALATQPAPAKLAPWTSVLRELLHKGSSRERTMAARVIVAWRLGELKSDLSTIAEDASQPAVLRLECLQGVVASYDILPEALFEFLLTKLRGDDALTAGELLRKARLTDAQLVEAIRSPNALVPPASLLAAFRKSTTAQHTRELLQAVAAMPAAGWNEKEYDEFAARLPDEFRKEAQALRSRFRPDGESQHARLAKDEPLLRGGDVSRGRIVFESAKVACLTCHAVGDRGGKIGPDLTRVGAIRSGRDLLESILVPSSTFAQGYETFAFETNNGEEHSGTIIYQDEENITVRTLTGTETTFSRSAIQNLRRTSVSIMPEGLEAALSEQEFRDLLAFLQGLR